MSKYDEVVKKALENVNHPLAEITRRNTYRARSPGVKPTTGIKLNLPKTSSMAMKMQKILDDESAEGRKKQKQMNNLVIGREESDKEISLEFKTSASRERFRKMMNESVELDEMKKSDGPFTVVAIKNNKVVGQLRNVEHYDIEVAIDMMRKDKQGAKISVESKKGKVVHTEEVELDESVKIMFKGFDMEQRVFTAKLKKFGFDKEYRKMMQNFMKHAKSGDGFYFIDGGRELGFQVHPVSDMMMGPKIKKLGDKQDLGGGKTATLIAIKEDVQVNEMSPFNVMGGKKTATPRKMGRDLENRLKMTKPSEYTFSAPAAGGGTFAVIPVDMKRPSMLSQAGVMMATFDKRGKVLAYYGTHMNTDAAKKFAKKEGLIESVQLDEGSTIEFKFDNPMKAGDFMRRLMRDKLASDVDRYDGDKSPEEIVQVTMHPNDYERNDIERLAKRYKGQLREDINESILGKLDKVLDKVERKLDRLARAYNNLPRNKAKIDRENKERIERVLKNFDKMVADLDRAYAHVDEDVQLDENVQNQVKRMDRRAKQKLADKLNDLDLSGYGDYEARVDNVHKFKPSDLKMAMEMMSLKEAESLRWTGMKNTEREELVRLAKVPARVTEMKWREIPNPLKERLAKYINKSTKGEFALVEERAKVPTYVIDRKTKKIVHGPTDTADAKLYLDKQITPRKFMIRQIRGVAKKVGDKV